MTQSATCLGQSHRTPNASRFGLDVRYEPTDDTSLADDVFAGLSRAAKSLPPKYFYDARGSRLFEQICDTDEYYPTRTEQQLLDQNADTIVRMSAPRSIVELGSGSARKISRVLESVEHQRIRCTYVPFDVSRSALEESGRDLLGRFPWLEVRGIVGDYDKDLVALPKLHPTLFMFLGGTVGNFTPDQASRFLKRLAKHMQPGDHLLLGTDLVKDAKVLNDAYNDSQGITAEFNKNVLSVINRELDASFDPEAFDHVAYFDTSKRQIEMYLESRQPQTVRIKDLNLDVHFATGERILTEISRKFTRDSVERMLADAGLQLNAWFEPPNGYFGLSVAQLA